MSQPPFNKSNLVELVNTLPLGADYLEPFYEMEKTINESSQSLAEIIETTARILPRSSFSDEISDSRRKTIQLAFALRFFAYRRLVAKHTAAISGAIILGKLEPLAMLVLSVPVVAAPNGQPGVRFDSQVMLSTLASMAANPKH